MVLASLMWATLGVLTLLVVLRAFNRATYRRGRAAMVSQLSRFLDDVNLPSDRAAVRLEMKSRSVGATTAPSADGPLRLAQRMDSAGPDELMGRWDGMPVHLVLGPYDIEYAVALPHAVVSYAALLERHGSDELRARLGRLELEVEGDLLVGRVPRENGLLESLVTVEQRIPIAAEVRALRRHAPGELLDALENARSAKEIDTLLVHLAAHFRFSLEMSEAIDLAAERDPQFQMRVRSRVREWMGMRPEPERDVVLVSDASTPRPAP